MRIFPRSRARSARPRASFEEMARGFSTNTCFPASRAARVVRACVTAGVATHTASIDGSSKTLRNDVVRSSSPPIAFSFCSSVSQMRPKAPTSRKTRTRFFPQYPTPTQATRIALSLIWLLDGRSTYIESFADAFRKFRY
jgi:hypothetical protein